MKDSPKTIRSEDEAPDTVRSQRDVALAETKAEKSQRICKLTSLFLTMALADDKDAGKSPVLDPEQPLGREMFVKFSKI